MKKLKISHMKKNPAWIKKHCKFSYENIYKFAFMLVIFQQASCFFTRVVFLPLWNFMDPFPESFMGEKRKTFGKWSTSSVVLSWICLRCLEKIFKKKYSPKWWWQMVIYPGKIRKKKNTKTQQIQVFSWLFLKIWMPKRSHSFFILSFSSQPFMWEHLFSNFELHLYLGVRDPNTVRSQWQMKVNQVPFQKMNQSFTHHLEDHPSKWLVTRIYKPWKGHV